MIRNIVFDMGNVVIRFDPFHFLDRAGVSDPEDRKILMNELFLSIHGMEDLIRRLKEAGYKIYLLSNASIMQHAYWPGFPASRYFDGKLISCDVKTVKPCHEIYRIFTEHFSLNPDECLFTDDSPANVAGAEACGWEGIVFHGSADELEMKMREKGVRF